MEPRRMKLLLRRVIYGRRWADEGDRWFNDLAQVRAHIDELEKDAKFDLFLDIARPAELAESPYPGSSVRTWSNELAVDWKGVKSKKEAQKFVDEYVNVARELAGFQPFDAKAASVTAKSWADGSRLETYKLTRNKSDEVVLTPMVPTPVHISTKDKAIERVLQAQLRDDEEETQGRQYWTVGVLSLLISALTGIILTKAMLS